MREFRLGLAIAMGIFLGLSAWSLAFPPRAISVFDRAGFQTAGFDGCGGFNNPCEITGLVKVDLNGPVSISPDGVGGFPIDIRN